VVDQAGGAVQGESGEARGGATLCGGPRSRPWRLGGGARLACPSCLSSTRLPTHPAPSALQHPPCPPQYRVWPNWSSWVFITALLADKLAFTAVLLSLYWGIGRAKDAGGSLNTAAALFMHSQLAAFSGIPYVSLLFRERRVFIREVGFGGRAAPACACLLTARASRPEPWKRAGRRESPGSGSRRSIPNTTHG
jgi:hypothetical protein